MKYLAQQGFKGISIDISKKAISLLKKNMKDYPGIILKNKNILSLKNGNKFDNVFALEVLEHVKEDVKVIKKIYSLLKPGGYFLLSVPAKMSLWCEIDEIKGHYRRYEKKELYKKLKSAGFTEIQIFDYGFPFLIILRKISSKGKHIISSSVGSTKRVKTMESGIQREYPLVLTPFVTNRLLTYPFFKILDLFIGSNLGLGYIASAEKRKK